MQGVKLIQSCGLNEGHHEAGLWAGDDSETHDKLGPTHKSLNTEYLW